MKTLQQEYQLIKEGKGNKDHFLKVAKHMFPEYITTGNDFDSTIHILKSKNLLSEAIGGIITMKPTKPNWFNIFNTNIREAVGVKNTKEYGNQNEFDAIDEDVQADLDNQFNNKDEKNIDNVYGQSFLNGFYTEMLDNKNKNKSVDEIKQIVAKNMAKDITYYNTKTSFGVKDIGYTKDVVGGGDAVAPKGKHKSSGYGDMPKAKVVKEGMEDSSKTYAVYKLAFGQPYNFYNEEKNKFIWSEPKEATLYTKEEAELKRRELLQPYVDNYQKTGDNYNEIHVGDLYKKNILKENQNIRHKIVRADKTRKEEIVFLPKEYNIKNTTDKKNYDLADSYRIILSPGDEIKATNTESLNTESKHGDEADLKIYKSELNMLNKIKPTGEKQLKRKAELEKKITDLEKKQTESLNEAKKSNVHTRIKDLEKQNEVLALESKISALDEAINELTQKVALSESDDLAEMMDPKKITELKKDIKVLEKYKITCEKKLSKLGGKKAVVVDEDTSMDDNNTMNEY